MKVYLAVPIVGSRDLNTARTVAHVISGLGHEVTSPWVLDEDSGYMLPECEIFNRDLEAVKASDIIVAEVTLPSHGVGMEVMAAYFHGVRIILLRKNETRVSRMLLGVPGVMILDYASPREMLAKLNGLLRELR